MKNALIWIGIGLDGLVGRLLWQQCRCRLSVDNEVPRTRVAPLGDFRCPRRVCSEDAAGNAPIKPLVLSLR